MKVLLFFFSFVIFQPCYGQTKLDTCEVSRIALKDTNCVKTIGFPSGGHAVSIIDPYNVMRNCKVDGFDAQFRKFNIHDSSCKYQIVINFESAKECTVRVLNWQTQIAWQARLKKGKEWKVDEWYKALQ